MTALCRFLTIALLAAACAAGSTEPAQGPAASRAGNAAAPALTFDVFTGDARGFFATSTLIMGTRDAVLVDAQFNLANGRRLAAWIRQKGKRLRAIVITHAHPDHYFGAEAVLARFPEARIYATAPVVAHMRELGPKKLAYWGPIYKDDLTRRPLVATALDGDTVALEGQTLRLIALPQGDAAPTTVVHVASLGLVVAGDLTYQGVHPWLAEAPTANQRAAWLNSLERVRRLEATAIVPGHRAPTITTLTGSLDETATYLRDFDRLRASQPTAAALIAEMTRLHPKALPIILELGAKAAYPAKPTP